MAWSSTVPATEANTGQSYLPARTSSRSLISALFLAPLVWRLAGKATPPHSCSRQLMGEKRGHQFPFRSHENSIVAVSFNNFGSTADSYVRISLGTPERRLNVACGRFALSRKERDKGDRQICTFAERVSLSRTNRTTLVVVPTCMRQPRRLRVYG